MNNSNKQQSPKKTKDCKVSFQEVAVTGESSTSSTKEQTDLYKESHSLTNDLSNNSSGKASSSLEKASTQTSTISDTKAVSASGVSFHALLSYWKLIWIRLWALIKKEFIVMLMDKGTRKILILPIIVQSILFGYGATFNLEKVPYVLFWQSQDQVSSDIVFRLQNNHTFELVKYCNSYQCYQDSIAQGQALLGVFIANDFTQTKTIFVASDARNTASANTAISYIQAIIQQYNQEQAYKYGLTNQLFIEYTSLYNPNNITRFGMMTGMILALSMIQVLMLSSLSVSREREEGTFDMMLMMPLSPVEILIGKAIPPTLISVIQGLVLFIICRYWFQIPFNGNFFALCSVITIFSLCTVGIGLTISAIASTPQQSIVTSFTITLPSIILSGLITPRSAMPEFVQYITLLNPFYYGLEALRRIYLEGQNFLDILSLLCPLIALGLITMGCAIYFFRGNLG